ncbi:glutamyl-tRNA reductase [gamma proteobacterium HTCC5015]|nr:glutamyl-tRNA reductase [gamma proteobacterium HTCC5015]
MPLSVLGLNHTSAPVDVRERIAYEGEALARVLHQLNNAPGVEEAVVVSTCNRSEFYTRVDDQQRLNQWLLDQNIEGIVPEQHLYQYHDAEAVRHLFRVASGLDSLVLGEPQILGQLKTAYQAARDCHSVGSALGPLFEQAFSVAKLVRSETDIGANPISVAFAAVRLAQQIFGELHNNTALLIGAGETIELAAQHLAGKDIGHVLIANRSVEKAEALAQPFGGRGLGIPDIPSALIEADIIISSTASPLPLLGKGMVETALKARKHRPFFMVDIAVPRDIEAEVGELDDVYLYTVDDLEQVIEENRQSRQEAALQAEDIIRLKIDDYFEWQRSQSAVDTISQLRHSVERTRDEALQKSLKLIEQGKPPEEALQLLAHSLTNKVLHAPTVQLRQAASENDRQLLEMARRLFDLDRTS